MGIDAVDTLQPEAADMEPAVLKRRFGSRLAFHGGISTGGMLANGTTAQAQAEVASVLTTMMAGGGYALSPAHAIQDDTPVGNVLAMYEVGQEMGRYE